ncbi:MAG TPA: hypothetical protein VL595_28470 [Pseudonocardia sp.]|nr:hypothetical protein [Pseudonocardia sp.]
MSSWSAAASRFLVLFLVTLVVLLCAGVRTTPPSAGDAGPNAHDTTLTAGVAAPRPPVLVPTTAVPVDALTVRLIDDRPRPALPQTADVAANRAPSTDPSGHAPHPLRLVGGASGTTTTTAGGDDTVTGDAVAFGALDAGGNGGIGSATMSGSGSGGSAAAVLSGLNDLAVHAGFTVARATTRTGTIHASVQPLDRPG